MQIPINEAIKLKLATRKELNEAAIEAKHHLISSRMGERYTEAILAENRRREKPLSLFVFGTNTIWVCSNHPEDLHDIREHLRLVLGQWEDEISSMNPVGEFLEVNYVGKHKYYGVGVYIEMKYPLNDLPKGLLKPGCKIITEKKQQRKVVCKL